MPPSLDGLRASLLNSLTTFDSLCETQGLEEPVGPVLPSLCYCPRNRLVGAHICDVSLLGPQATHASDVTRRDDSGPPSLITPSRPGPSCSLATLAQCFRRRALTPWSQRRRGSVLRSTPRSTARAPWMRRGQRERLPRFVSPSSVVFSPVGCCRGTRPSQAAHWRPCLQSVASPTAATSAVAIRGPIPASGAS